MARAVRTVTPTDPHLDGGYRWWHLSEPSPELLAAAPDGWLTGKGTAIDIGCGRLASLASANRKAVGIDLSEPTAARPLPWQYAFTTSGWSIGHFSGSSEGLPRQP